ncbi:MAG: hypothetical protein QXL16_02750, partial [Candidatus Micrarchaeaceae archaeon]
LLHEGYHFIFHKEHMIKKISAYYEQEGEKYCVYKESTRFLASAHKVLKYDIVTTINEGFAALLQITKKIKDNKKEIKDCIFGYLRSYLVREGTDENAAYSIAKEVCSMAKSSNSLEEFIEKIDKAIKRANPSKSLDSMHMFGPVIALFELICKDYDEKEAIARSIKKRPDEILSDIFAAIRSNKRNLEASILSLLPKA